MTFHFFQETEKFIKRKKMVRREDSSLVCWKHSSYRIQLQSIAISFTIKDLNSFWFEMNHETQNLTSYHAAPKHIQPSIHRLIGSLCIKWPWTLVQFSPVSLHLTYHTLYFEKRSCIMQFHTKLIPRYPHLILLVDITTSMSYLKYLK